MEMKTFRPCRINTIKEAAHSCQKLRNPYLCNLENIKIEMRHLIYPKSNSMDCQKYSHMSLKKEINELIGLMTLRHKNKELKAFNPH